jgi:hypothetical protein
MPHNFTQEGTWDESSLLVGDWSEVYVELTGTQYRVGNVPEGVLEIGREFIEHVDTSFPRMTDLVVQSRVWMKYTGKVEEVNVENVAWLLGQSLSPTSNYLYIGDIASPLYHTFFGQRIRVSDQVAIVFRMHKCLVRSLFSLGGGDEWAGSPLEIEALNDTDGDYGGSATDPLGWIWVPDRQS